MGVSLIILYLGLTLAFIYNFTTKNGSKIKELAIVLRWAYELVILCKKHTLSKSSLLDLAVGIIAFKKLFTIVPDKL